MPGHISLLYTFLLVVGVLLIVFRLLKVKKFEDKEYYELIILVTLAFVYVVFTIVRIKTDRYVLPVFFLFALIIAKGVMYLLRNKNKWIKDIGVVVLVLVLLVGVKTVVVESYDVHEVDSFPWVGVGMREIDNEAILHIVEHIKKLNQSNNAILSISQFPYHSIILLNAYLLQEGVMSYTIQPYDDLTSGAYYSPDFPQRGVKSYFEEADWVIIDRGLTCAGSLMDINDCINLVDKLQTYFMLHIADYDLIYRSTNYSLSNGVTELYKKRSEQISEKKN